MPGVPWREEEHDTVPVWTGSTWRPSEAKTRCEGGHFRVFARLLEGPGQRNGQAGFAIGVERFHPADRQHCPRRTPRSDLPPA